MKKLLCILILLAFVGCGKGTASPAEAAPATAQPTVLQAAEASPAPTAAKIVISAAATPTVTPMATPTPSPEPTATPTPAPTATPEPTPVPGPLDGVVIGLDPGHQLHYDPAPEPVAPGSKETKQKVAGGCKGVKSGVYEYEVNLNVALLLRDMLEEAGATVVMTHDVLDVNISNIRRAQIFNEAGVHLGLRLHCNKGGSPKLKGAFMIVPTENRTRFYAENVYAAQTIIGAYCQETGLPTRYDGGLTYRGDQTGFNWCERPIVTIEMGHLSNPEEDALLSDPAFQARMARGLFNGILQYFRPDLAESVHE